MSFDPFTNFPGGYSPNDGTIDFYSRIKCLANPEMVVLDFGAGRGAWYKDDTVEYRRDTRLLKGAVRKVIAVDVDDAVIHNPSADECLLMENNTIPVSDNSIDLIVADYVLEHIDEPQWLYKEVNRTLKSGGWFCARTPHKYSYVSIFAKLIKNRNHPKALRRIQPDRKEIDIFPTRYKLNTLRDISRLFRNFESQSFIFRNDPAYYFGTRWLFLFFSALHRILPSFMRGTLYVFLKKK